MDGREANISKPMPDGIRHIAGDIWIKRQPLGHRPDGTQTINVCLRLEDGSMAALEMLSLRPDGMLLGKEKEIGHIESVEFGEYIKKFQFSGGISSAGSPPSQSEEELYKRVSEAYAQEKSIKKAAKLSGISEQKARRILFTTGEYTCETHERIMKLQKEDMSLDEIASIVGLSRDQVRSYMPY